MKIIDLTHIIKKNMPVYPGTEPPVIGEKSVLKKDGYNEKRITMNSHLGTHMDAPAHMINRGKTLDSYEPSAFTGSVAVLNAETIEGEINLSHLKRIESKISEIDFLLIFTGWDKKWGSLDYYKSYPVLSEESAKFLVTMNLKGIGLDVISPDPVETDTYKIHEILLGGELLIIENMKNINLVADGDYLYALPLKIEDADGAPVRAVVVKV